MTDHGLPTSEILLRLGYALVCGALIGIDRDLQGKDAGPRTFGLVALGTAGITIGTLAAVAPDAENVGRIVQGVLTGIGFLGAGVIMRRENEGEVLGLTTAAAVWFTAAIAMVCGLGEFGLATAMLASGLALLLGGRAIERLAERLARRRKG